MSNYPHSIDRIIAGRRLLAKGASGPEWSRFARWMGFCCISSAFHLHFMLGPRRNDGLFSRGQLARGVRGKQEEKRGVVVTITGAQLIFGAGTVTITVGGSAHSRHPPPI